MASEELTNQAGWQVTVDRNRCIGSSMCEGIAPSQFVVADGAARPRDEVLEPADVVREAAGLCPVEAITIFDAVTGTEIPPQF